MYTHECFANLQNAFIVFQNTLLQLKLVLNADKTKCVLFTNSRNGPLNIASVVTLEGSEIQFVNSYKYLGILIDDSLTFKPHVLYLVRKLRLKLGFSFRNKCFSFNAKKQLVAALFYLCWTMVNYWICTPLHSVFIRLTQHTMLP